MSHYPLEDTIYQGNRPSASTVTGMDRYHDDTAYNGASSAEAEAYPAHDKVTSWKEYAPIAASDPEPFSPDSMHSQSHVAAAQAPASPESERANIGFAKSALILHDRLDALREKRTKTDGMTTTTTTTTTAAKPATPSESDTAKMPSRTDAAEAVATKRRDRFVKFLQIVQSLVTAVMSITIAVLQIRVFAYYQGTKDEPGLYPPHLDLLPTLLLLAVSLAAIVFDLAQLAVFFMPKSIKVVRVAALIAAKAHYVVVAAKASSYFFSAIVAKQSGGGAGNNLWSWSCDGKGAGVAGLCGSQVKLPKTPWRQIYCRPRIALTVRKVS
jgi:hypothetical protein